MARGNPVFGRIDYMEEGQNSSWLLPNRIYESGRYGAVPVALAGVQTGRFLAERGFGVRLNDPDELEGFLERLTPERYTQLRAELCAVPTEAFAADERDCRKLLEAISGQTGSAANELADSTAKLVA